MMRPPPLFDHHACGTLQAEENAACVDVMNTVPVIFGQVHDIGAAGHARIVDDDIELAEFGRGFRDHCVNRRHIADVDLHRQRFDLVGCGLVGAALRRF